jgi:serine/arginine repetitive matrix protein 2
MVVPVGAMLAIPFQKASIFSRSRSKDDTEDDDTYKKTKLAWSDHMVRRSIFILTLPFAGLGYTLSSTGPPVSFVIPILLAGLIGFLSNLAMAECHGILMETFDTSDLSPGMAGRARGSAGDKAKGKRTNYSSFPRVQSAFAITQSIGFIFSAISIGVGGSVTRQLGQQAATGVFAGILLILTLLLLLVLVRMKDVQIIPDSKKDDMSKWKNARRTSAFLRSQGAKVEEPWRPIIIGNPTHHTRRVNILEMGSLTRWEEIRRKNRLVDANSLEALHPNLVVIEDVEERFFGKKPPPQPQIILQVPPQRQMSQEPPRFQDVTRPTVDMRRDANDDQGYVVNPDNDRYALADPQRSRSRNPKDQLMFTADVVDRRDSRRLPVDPPAGNEGARRRTTRRE